MLIKLRLLATAASKYLPSPVVARLVKHRPFWRDLQPRLLKIPMMKRGTFIENLPTDDRELMEFGSNITGAKFYYGYRIITNGDKDTIDTLLMCVDGKGNVLEDEKRRLEHNTYYLGVRIPEQDLKSMRYSTNFERMDYVLRNLE